MKKILLISAILLLAGCSTNTPYKMITDKSNYKEYSFKPNEKLENQSRIILAEIQKNPKALSYQKNIIPISDEGQYENIIPNESYFNVGSKKYTLKLIKNEIYAVYDGSTKLLERRMCWPADQADGSPQLLSINNKLAVRFFDCVEQIQAGNTTTLGKYATNMYYDGEFINETYNVTDTSFIFSYNEKIGFVAKQADQAYIYYNGKQISSGFDSIYTKNCCALNELTPTLYDNGVLVFYGKKDDQSIIAEIILE